MPRISTRISTVFPERENSKTNGFAGENHLQNSRFDRQQRRTSRFETTIGVSGRERTLSTLSHGRLPALSVLSIGYFQPVDDDISLSKIPAVELATAWTSLYILSAICLLAGIQFTIFFSSLWPFLNTIDPDASATFFGFITGGYSLGQVLASPVFGWWMNKSRSVKWPLTFGLTMMIISNIVFACVEDFPTTSRRYVLLITRCIVGAGSGIIGLTRAYCATASTLADRAKAITLVQAAFLIGTIMGPAFMILFTPIGYPALHFGPVHVDMYTSPAIMCALVHLISLFLLHFKLEERYAGVVSDEKKEDPFFALPKFDKIAAGVCIMTQFTQMFVITNLETLGSIYSILMWDWTNKQTVLYNGLMQGSQGLTSFVIYLLFAFKIGSWVQNGRERLGTIFGLALSCIWHAATYPWPFYPYKLENNFRVVNESNGDQDDLGCDRNKYNWCDSTPEVNFWVYALVALIQSVGWPCMSIAMNTLYSKILGPRRQGTMQGVQLMAGGVARTVGPILVTFLFDHWGPKITWGMEVAVILTTILMWVIFYRRLIPLNADPILKPGEYFEYKRGYKYRF